MRSGINCNMTDIIFYFARQRVNFTDTVDFVTEKFNTYCRIRGVYRIYFDRVSAYSEFITNKVDVISLILDFD